MKKLLLVFCLLLPTYLFSANVVVNDFQTNSRCGGISGCTTPGVNSTGADSGTCYIAYNNGASVVLTDSKTSTWVPGTPKVGVQSTLIQYNAKFTGGAAHTFTLTGTNIFAQVVCLTFSGGNATTLFDREESSAHANANSLSTGNITPNFVNTILVAGWAGDASVSAMSCNNSFSTAFFSNYSGGAYFGIAACYKIQTSIVAEGTLFDWTSDIGSIAVITSLRDTTTAATNSNNMLVLRSN